MQFLLSGWLGGNEDVFARNVNVVIEANDPVVALTKAKEILKELRSKWESRGGGKQFNVTLYRPIWKIRFVEAQPEQPAVPARPAVEEHVEEDEL